MYRVHRVKGEGPGFSSVSPDRRTNIRRKRERVNKVAAKVVEVRVLLTSGMVW